uniref:Uncharacterized protein n=1 Tax=Tetranychus urticae TaxID=32264 RepID=T1KMK1_TETUR
MPKASQATVIYDFFISKSSLTLRQIDFRVLS